MVSGARLRLVAPWGVCRLDSPGLLVHLVDCDPAHWAPGVDLVCSCADHRVKVVNVSIG